MPEVGRTFEEVWPLLRQTWHSNGHCMRLGCGRDTLTHWVYKSTGVLVRPNELRRHALEADHRELLLVVRKPPEYTKMFLQNQGQQDA